VRGLPRAEAASSTVVWLRQRLHASPAAAQRLVRLAEILDTSPALDSAMAAGAVSAEQARVIGTAITDLPDEVGIDLTARAETALIDYASQFDPIALAQLGTRILAHVDPEAADRYDGALLKRQEERARRGRGFTMSPLGDGRVRLSGWLDNSGAATVAAALNPLCRPAKDAGLDAELVRTPMQRRADALVDVCARVLRDGGLPAAGGETAQVVVTVPITTLQTTALQTTALQTTTLQTTTLQTTAPQTTTLQTTALPPSDPLPTELPRVAGPGTAPRPRSGRPPTARGSRSPGASSPRGGPSPSVRADQGQGGAATAVGSRPADGRPPRQRRDNQHGVLDNGALVSPAEARLLACDAQIIPAVLGTAGQVLDVGRARRLFTGPIRRALVLRDRGCSFPGCDRPPAWSEGHHIVPWADGGATALSNACLLCRHHHRVIHDTDWQVRLSPDGHPEFLPPPTIDPQRRPRRNSYHLRQ
jgi:hypothetical protein